MKQLDFARKNVRQSDRRHSAPMRRRRQFFVEGLESRALMTILFTPQNGAEIANDGGGPRLGTVSWGMPLYTIFWGSYWSTSAGQQLQSQVQNSLNSIFYDSAFLSGLHQYGVTYPAGVSGSGTVEVNNYSDPANGFSDSSLQSVISYAISNQGLPDANTYSTEGLYLVFTPPNIHSSDPNENGFHSYYNSSPTRDYAWIGDFGGLSAVYSRVANGTRISG